MLGNPLRENSVKPMQHDHTTFCCFEERQFNGRARAQGEHVQEEISTRETKGNKTQSNTGNTKK